MRMPVQSMQRCVGGPSPNTGCKVLPLSCVYGLSINVVNGHRQFLHREGRRKGDCGENVFLRRGASPPRPSGSWWLGGTSGQTRDNHSLTCEIVRRFCLTTGNPLHTQMRYPGSTNRFIERLRIGAEEPGHLH
jgi:hypothetical protein